MATKFWPADSNPCKAWMEKRASVSRTISAALSLGNPIHREVAGRLLTKPANALNDVVTVFGLSPTKISAHYLSFRHSLCLPGDQKRYLS